MWKSGKNGICFYNIHMIEIEKHLINKGLIILFYTFHIRWKTSFFQCAKNVEKRWKSKK
ncbi:hypothetical protein EUBDOL_00819 [Amedibacillus dolichus DSM 3991]|uniref:Uncharacterized protein n=1 Tax=Amedibacillus dolichus DSM 3991 TaxID=428127 RepID=A8RAI3_9FIRM|nr:hypothetical protein EUBDOL_00819 [Amedibacillus dolichus DSM 3991]